MREPIDDRIIGKAVQASYEAAAAWSSPVTLLTITYISDALMDPAERSARVEQIVTDARPRNARLGVTGTLLFTGTRFAQTIEGDEAVVDALMARIGDDKRHCVRAIIERHPINQRRFSTWSMAYSGDSAFVSQRVARALSGALSSPPTDDGRLLQMLREFTLDGLPRRAGSAAAGV